jgi:hypothetical protein
MGNNIKKLTKQEILAYYHALAYPEQTEGALPVPPDLRLKAFEKLVQWQGVKVPGSVTDGAKPQKYVIEIRTQE